MLTNVFTKTIRDRWRGEAIAAVTLAVLFLFAMAVYRDIDVSFYTDLPEAFRALVNIPEDADIGALAYGAIYGSYGAMTLAAMSIAMGSASIAGEERKGTIGLLLSNPQSRTNVLVGKAAAMVVLTGLGALVLWGAGELAPVILDVSISGTHVGAFALHLFVMAVFFGFLAMAIGAWTGSPGAASGVAAAVMLVSFVAAGLFPIIEGLESLAKAFPWYYFIGSQPVNNGADWGHLAVLLAGIVLFAGASLVGVNRRDLKGQAVGTTLVDRLRGNPMTQKVFDRLAGTTRVSQIWIKTASEHQGLLMITAGAMFLMGVMIGPMYTLMDESLARLSDQFPETLLALFGGGDMSTPEGFFQIEIFGLMAPIAVMVVAVAIGARALAGEEENHTMGLLLANPVRRSKIVLEKAWAMVVYAFVVGFAIFASVTIGSLLGGLGMNLGDVAATSLLVTLVGLVFGSLSLALSAGTGQVRIALYGAVGAALIFYVLNAFLQLDANLGEWARVSPFYYYLGSDPLLEGMHWGHGALLGGLSVSLIGLAVWLFSKRDLRQTG